MEKRKFSTILKESYKGRNGNTLYCNDYVKGIVLGYLMGLSEDHLQFRYLTINYKTSDMVFTVTCTEEKYKKFKTLVEFSYPELCEFDIGEIE